jgi:hypothetical protein
MNYLLKPLLTIIFFVILTPIGLFFRVFGVDYLQINSKKESYWIDKE